MNTHAHSTLWQYRNKKHAISTNDDFNNKNVFQYTLANTLHYILLNSWMLCSDIRDQLHIVLEVSKSFKAPFALLVTNLVILV